MLLRRRSSVNIPRIGVNSPRLLSRHSTLPMLNPIEIEKRKRKTSAEAGLASAHPGPPPHSPPPPYSHVVDEDHPPPPLLDILQVDEASDDPSRGLLRGHEDCLWWPAFLKKRPVLTIFVVMGFNGLVSLAAAALFLQLEGPAQTDRFRAKEVLRAEVQAARRGLEYAFRDKTGFNASLALSKLANYSAMLETLASIKEEIKWDMTSASFFVSVLSSTTGYGDIVAVTTPGRVFVLIYALYGIPVFVWYIVKLGLLFRAILTRVMEVMREQFSSALEPKAVTRYHHRRNFLIAFAGPPHQIKTSIGDELRLEVRFHPSVIGLILLAYLFSVAGFISYMEGYTYLDAFYACFITYSTIGFGDIDIYRISSTANWFIQMVYGDCIHIVGYTLVSAWVSSVIDVWAKRKH